MSKKFLIVISIFLVMLFANRNISYAKEASNSAKLTGTLQTGDLLETNDEVHLLKNYTAAEKAIQKGIDNFKYPIKNLSKYKLTTNDIATVVSNILNKNPKYFYVGQYYQYQYNKYGYITDLYLSYTYPKSEVKTYEKAVKNVLSSIKSSWTDFEKIMYVNDYLALNCKYDTNYQNYNAYNVFVDKTAVCQGYALAFLELMNRLGIECELVTSREINHAWNAVKLNKKWYYVDVTWDDPVPDLVGYAGHNNLLKSQTYFNKNQHKASDYQFTSSSISKKSFVNKGYDDYLWEKITSPFVYYSGYWYTNDSGNIKKYKASKTGLKYVSTEYENNEHSIGISILGNKVYYATATKTDMYESYVHEYDLKTKKDKVIYTQEYGLGYIEGTNMATDGTLYYNWIQDGYVYSESMKLHKHSYQTTTKEATTKANGSTITKCKKCGYVKKKTTIYYPKTVKLSSTNYVYSGKTYKPSVTVTDSKGNKISSKNYTLTYSKGRKTPGKYTVTITFKNDYSGTVKKTFKINPKATSISKVKAQSKACTVAWKKQTTQTTGYQIQYSTSSSFKSANKIVNVGKNSTLSQKISKLTKGKKYYIRVRTYKTVEQVDYYSSWSSAKSVRV